MTVPTKLSPVPAGGALRVPDLLRRVDLRDAHEELSAGVSLGLPVLSYRGKVFRLRHRGQETVWMDPMAANTSTFTCVLVKATKHLSKAYYARAYTPGSIDPPACWSTDGVRPDAAVVSPVNPVCATCPKNQFGSRTSSDRAESNAKACGDFRRVAVLPINDLAGELFGGPILLRVPPASLAPLSTYAAALRQAGVPYYGVVTQIRFATSEFPQLEFLVAGELSDEHAKYVLHWRDHERTNYILAAAETEAVAAPAPAPAPVAAPVAAQRVRAVPDDQEDRGDRGDREDREDRGDREDAPEEQHAVLDIDALLERAAADLAKRKRGRPAKALD